MKNSILLLLFLPLTIFNCNNSIDQFIYQPPEKIADGLQVGSLSEVNIDIVKISTAAKKIQEGKYGEVHAMLIYKNDFLVLEAYFPGHKYQWDGRAYHGELVNWDQNIPHEIMSCTKSITSACIGIAIDMGFINSIHQSIFDYLPDHQHLNVDNKKNITIKHLITMTSGLAWDEWSVAHGSAANDIDMLWFDCDKTIDCVLKKPWRKEPGQLFTYNGGGMVILSEIIKNATGQDIYDFAKVHLLKPLGIENTTWYPFPSGVRDGAGSLHMLPRDMIKFGATYLNDGHWNGTRIISSAWIKNSSEPFHNNIDINIPGQDSGKNGYGYTWWISEFSHSGKNINMFRAGGWGGQEIMVFPELDMVVVFTGGNYNRKTKLYKLLKKYILPSIN